MLWAERIEDRVSLLVQGGQNPKPRRWNDYYDDLKLES